MVSLITYLLLCAPVWDPCFTRCAEPQAMKVGTIWASGYIPGKTIRNASKRQTSLLVKGFKIPLGGREKQNVTQGACSQLFTRKRISYEPGSGDCAEMET